MLRINLRWFVVSGCLAFATATPSYAEEPWLPWADLAKFKPDQTALISARTNRGHTEKKFDVQRIADGSGKAVNVDEYVVDIIALPSGMTKTELFKHVRVNLNSFLDQSVAKFRPHAAGDKVDWAAETDAKLGTIMVFEIALGVGASDDGAVVVSNSGPFEWIFSPIEDGVLGDFGTHPVAGNRLFGMRERGGKLQFFTRAVDRVYPTHVSLNEKAAFEGADKLWQSMQTKLVMYVESKNGSAKALEATVPGGNIPSKKPQYSDVCKDPTLNLKC